MLIYRSFFDLSVVFLACLINASLDAARYKHVPKREAAAYVQQQAAVQRSVLAVRTVPHTSGVQKPRGNTNKKAARKAKKSHHIEIETTPVAPNRERPTEVQAILCQEYTSYIETLMGIGRDVTPLQLEYYTLTKKFDRAANGAYSSADIKTLQVMQPKIIALMEKARNRVR